MESVREPESLTSDEIESIEKQSLRVLFTAATDFGFDAWEIFHQSNDDPKDVAEDVTREMLDRLGGYSVLQRIFGDVDYRKARYVILPDFAVRQALFVDSKAEKDRPNSATLQMSQLSLRVRQNRAGTDVDVPGKIGVYENYDGRPYLSTILLTHYYYEGSGIRSGRDVPPYYLKKLTVAAIPNGVLQDRYNPDPINTIWRAGRDAPSRGEEFRVRLSFPKLKEKMHWRVQTVEFDRRARIASATWSE